MSAAAKQTLGQYLKETREARGLSIDEASRETNIAKRYLEALEKDEFGFMPAEMYATGFLATYAEVLELDREAVLSMYTRVVSKEQEVPLQELYEVSKKEPAFKFRFELLYPLAAGLALVLLVYLGVLGLRRLSAIQQAFPKKNTVITLETLSPTNSFTATPRDSLILEREGRTYTLDFQGIRNKNQIAFRLGKNQYVQKSGDILTADLTQDGVNDIGMEIIEVASDYVRLSFSTQNLSADINNASSILGFDLTPYTKSILSEAPLAAVGQNASFRLKISAAAALWIQHKPDSAPLQELILDPGEEKTITFRDSLVLLLGNSGAADLTILEYPGLGFKGGAVGESSYSLFYKKGEADKLQLFRAQLK